MPVAVRKYNQNHEKMWGSSARREFAALHYPGKGKLSGQVIFTGEGFQKVRHERTGEAVSNYIYNMYVRKQQYHITCNSFSGAQRDNEHLFGLHNIVIDLDCPALHQQDTPLTPAQFAGLERMYDRLVYAVDVVYPDGLPRPNTIVYTGRGYQLWFALEQCSGKLVALWQAVARGIAQRLQSWLQEIGMDNLAVDIPASARAAGLARLPGSYHPIARRWGYFTILHWHRADLLVLAEDLGVGYVREANKGQKVVALPQSGVEALTTNACIRMLEGLVALRRANGTLMGSRDEILFCYFNRYPAALDDQAMEATLRLNEEMGECAFSAHRVHTYLSTSRRKHYTVTDQRVAERVGITAEECEALGWMPSGVALSVRQMARLRRIEKERRNADILARVAAGETQAALAAEYGIHPSTVSKMVGKAQAQAQAQELEQAAQEKEKEKEETNNTIPMSTAIAGCSRGRTSAPISRMQKKAKTRNHEKMNNESIFMPPQRTTPGVGGALPSSLSLGSLGDGDAGG